MTTSTWATPVVEELTIVTGTELGGLGDDATGANDDGTLS